MQPTLVSRTICVNLLCRDPILRCGLDAALVGHDDIAVRQESWNARPEGVADVVICDYDVAMALAGPILNRLSQASPVQSVLVYASSLTEDEIRQAMKIGVLGCVLSDVALEEIAKAVRAVASGRRYLSAAAANRMAQSVLYAPLSAREAEVLQHLGTGECNKVIARRLGIAVPTVKDHVKAIVGKMNATSRSHAVSVAASRGLVSWTS